MQARFEYVTDDALNDGGWEADGFARVNNLVPEEFLVQIVRKAPGGAAQVTRLLLDGEADGEIRLAGMNAEQGEQVAVIVSAVGDAGGWECGGARFR